jgi:hypothetical protein
METDKTSSISTTQKSNTDNNMAGDWIKIEHALPDKPEVMDMAAILGIDADAVVGKLIRVWTWFDNHTVNGNAPVTVRALLDRYTGVSNFILTMQDVGWISEQDGLLTISHFDRHNGQTAKNRANTNRRVAKSRKCNGASVTNVTDGELRLPLQKPLPEKRREEKSIERMAKPSVDEIFEYGKTLDPPFRKAESFVAFYESNGWKVGKNPMKDWKAAVRTWQQKDKTTTATKPRPIHEEFSYQKNGTSQHRPLWD